MITEREAHEIVEDLFSDMTPNQGRPWELQEFDQGWLVRVRPRPGEENNRGAAARVVERGSGRVMRFPSGVPTRRILTDYPKVVRRGREESRGMPGSPGVGA